MPRASHVTSSGFVFDRYESTIVIHCSRALVPAAELEYLREVEPGLRGGRISGIRRTGGDGRELHLVTVELPAGGERTLTFDAGPALLGYFRQVTNGIMYVVYGLAATTAIGTLGYLMVRLAGGG
jgi:hypothetical protein